MNNVVTAEHVGVPFARHGCVERFVKWIEQRCRALKRRVKWRKAARDDGVFSFSRFCAAVPRIVVRYSKAEFAGAGLLRSVVLLLAHDILGQQVNLMSKMSKGK